MLKKTIVYNDYDGNERSENFYFNLSKAEVMEMEFSFTGGMTNVIEQMVNTQDTARIMELFKKIIMMAYGEKSADGKRFMKIGPDGRRLAEGFVETEAYSELFMELVSDPKKFADFIAAVIPALPADAKAALAAAE